MKHSHEFALYINNVFEIDTLFIGQEILIKEPLLYHRLVRVLRLACTDSLILFNQHKNSTATVTSITKNAVALIIKDIRQNCLPSPYITFCLPLLKKEALDQAVYGLTEVGVNAIQLIITKKTHSQTFRQKDYDRLCRIIISASEQCKQFFFPSIGMPIELQEYLKNRDVGTRKILFHPEGQPLLTFKENIILKNNSTSLSLFIGPEGDLTVEEKKLLEISGAQVVSLTPTILRSVTAAQLGAGIIRSIF